jgi:uncharacterized lipoprotein YbaY
MKTQFLIALSLLVLALGACKSDAANTETTQKDAANTEATTADEITGIITYRDDGNIPSTADITIRLVDLSAEDKKVVSETTFKTGSNGKPFSFTLPYDADAIEVGKIYGLDADINFMVASLYYTLEPVEVLNNGLKNEITMILVKGPKSVK